MFGVGAALVVGALPLGFLRGTEAGPPPGMKEESMGEVVWKIFGMLLREPDGFTASSVTSFLEGPLPALTMVLSYLLILPAGFLIFLASHSAGFGWLGRVLWLLVWAAGPATLLVLLSDSAFVGPGVGFWCWFHGVLTVAGSHWVMAPREPRPPAPPAG